MSQPNTKLANELNRIILAEFDRSIANLRSRGKEKDADRLERFKKVFFVKDRNFEVIKKDGTIRHC